MLVLPLVLKHEKFAYNAVAIVDGTKCDMQYADDMVAVVCNSSVTHCATRNIPAKHGPGAWIVSWWLV